MANDFKRMWTEEEIGNNQFLQRNLTKPSLRFGDDIETPIGEYLLSNYETIKGSKLAYIDVKINNKYYTFWGVCETTKYGNVLHFDFYPFNVGYINGNPITKIFKRDSDTLVAQTITTTNEIVYIDDVSNTMSNIDFLIFY